MRNILIILLFFLCIYSNSHGFEPYSGIKCQNEKQKIIYEFFFKKNNNEYKVFKRIDGKFSLVGNVVGKKISSFILFEDKTMYPNFDFAWHLDEVTKNLTPMILSNVKKIKIKTTLLSCISKNFWY